MFVKKLVDFATKKPGGSSNSLRTDDINPRLVFHYGIPAGSSSLAYDSIQKILAICTKDGRIKLYGKDNTQALLESDEAVSSKFLQFMENQGILLNVNAHNHIEVWDIERKQLCHVHAFKGKITSFMVIQRSSFAYIGDSLGNVSVLNLERELSHLICMQYNIPFTASHGNTIEVAEATAVMFTLPQPLSERRRVLIIYRDGLIILWGIQESKPVFATGGNTLNLLVPEAKQVTSACWACPYGSKVIVGYSNGEILLWSVPIISNQKKIPTTDKGVFCAAQNVPILKLNLGYKMEKIPIVSLRWVSGDARASRLYVNGVSEDGSSSSFQVNLLQENSESRMIKLVLPLSKSCLDMEIISCMSNHNNDKQDLLLLLESGHLCAFDDSEIEKYLLQSQQSKGSPQLQNNIKVKLPFVDSSITQAIFITNNSDLPNYIVEDHMPVKTFPSLFATNAKGKGGNYLSSTHFSGFTKIKNLYITGHANGAINFWDVSCPFFILVLSVVQQSEDDPSLSGVPVTSLYFDIISRVLVSGDQQGMVRIFNFKEQANTKQGCSHIIRSMKLVKVIGAVLSIQANPGSGRLAVGSDEGCVSIIDKERATILWQKRFSAEIYTGVMALQFVDCILNTSQKGILLVALKDSSVLGLEGDTGNPLSSCGVRSKKPSRALLMQILDGQDTSVHGSNITSSMESNEGNGVKESTSKQSIVLVCSEKAARVYSFMHLVQGIKKVHNKKKFHGTCCWASTFISLSSDIGLILLFTSGKIEIRSLPDLSLLKETWIRGFTFSSSAPSSNSSQSISCSSEGELILVNGDQEIFLFSILFRNDIYRHVDSMTQVYSEAVPAQDRHTSVSLVQKEKKKGFFSSVMKDIKGNKAKQSQDTEVVDSEESNEELAVLFSAPNFPLNVEDQDGLSSDENDVKLNIDDIDLEDEGGKPKARSNLILNKHKLAGKLQAIKGKLIAAKVKNTETSVKEELKDDKNATSLVDIKKRYGYPMASDPSTPKLAESKLNENMKKLQGINTRATAMENTAQSFSSTAKELLRIVQEEKRTT